MDNLQTESEALPFEIGSPNLCFASKSEGRKVDHPGSEDMYIVASLSTYSRFHRMLSAHFMMILSKVLRTLSDIEGRAELFPTNPQSQPVSHEVMLSKTLCLLQTFKTTWKKSAN